jgi:hypothetical protein
MVDGFSKFVWLFLLRDMTVREVVNTLVRYIFGQYGVPEANISDNAAVFRSKIFKDCCFMWGVKHITTSPYYPQPSLVERFNRNLKAALVAFHHDQQIPGMKISTYFKMGSTLLGMRQQNLLRRNCFWEGS